MKNTWLIITGFFLSFVSSVWAKKPNVIIMTDDHRYGDLSCHGNPILKTPNLDQLHSESVRFTDFHVSPFCTPTRSINDRNHPGVTGAYRTSAGRTMLHPSEKQSPTILRKLLQDRNDR